MPCTAKKFEAGRPEMTHEGLADIDAVLTTRELARIIRMRGLDLRAMEPETADTPFGERTSAGKLFGASGGVMEAAIRSAYYLVTGKEMADPLVTAVRGTQGIKEAKIMVDGLELGVAVANGLGNAAKLMNQLRAGRSDLHFIEVMTCPGGCVGGGGQPWGTNQESVRARMQALYQIDGTESVRVSHKNACVQRIYAEFLGQPLSEKSHHLLHTHYAKRETLV
jgi:NADH-quinone oxidoreductase subunit G/NADP-reducing hydrogenase subunit HndD